MPLSLGELIRKDFPPESHLISNGLLHDNSIMLVGGPPKAQKSFLINTMMMQLATASPLLSATHKGKHGDESPAFTIQKNCRILLFEQEVGEMDMQTRFRDMLDKMLPEHRAFCESNIFIHSCDHEKRLDTIEGRDRIAKDIESLKPDIVCFDPLKEFHSLEENSSKDMGLVFSNLDWLRERLSFASIITHHTGKPSQADPKQGPEKLRGSSYIFGKGDTFLMLKPYGKNHITHILVDITLRRGKPIPSFYIRADMDTLEMKFWKWAVGNSQVEL